MQRRWKKVFFSEGDKFTQGFVGWILRSKGRSKILYIKKKKKMCSIIWQIKKKKDPWKKNEIDINI
jgi:hypothetical protein